MRTGVETVSLSEAAHMLRSELGPLKNWVSFLNDINVGKPSSVRGLQIAPCLKQHDGRSFRPRYALADVEKFIKAVQAIEPNAKPAPIRTTAFSVDTGRAWFANKFDRHGHPVAMLRHIFGNTSTTTIAN